MNRRASRRGQPLVALALLAMAWTGVRVMAWSGERDAPVPVVIHPPAAAAAGLAPSSRTAELRGEAGNVVRAPAGTAPDFLSPTLAPQPLQQVPPEPLPLPTALSPAPAPVIDQGNAPRPNPTLAGGHNLLYLAALSHIPMPPELLAARAPQPAATAPRWSADAWLLLRRDRGPASLAAISGSYGASQAGAVLRYRLDTTSARKPSVYLRATGALAGGRDEQLALGFSARPVGKLPVLALAEARLMHTATGTRVRPAAMVVSELPEAHLPLGFKGDAYVQAGYVAGKDATAFVDGQLRIERKVLSLGKADLRAGGGVWGGAQQGASRLDIGPSASLSFRLDPASARLSADWRFRVGGNAAPASGPALTLSAGF